jgi:hypothetical protein
MILGLDHVAVAVTGLTTGNPLVDASLQAVLTGANTLFADYNLPNPPEKKPLLHQYTPTHSLMLVQPENGVRLELTDHGQVVPGDQGIHVNGQTITITSHQPSMDRAFWQALLRSDTHPIDVNPLLGPAYGFRLAVELGPPAVNAPLPMLDTAGYGCLAFVVSRFERDAGHLLACGGTVASDPFHLTVNGQALTVGFFRSPSGHMMEYIQPHRS